MPMYEVLTVRQIVAKCKEYDPGTDINRDMLNTLFREGKIPYDMHGNRLVADFYAVIHCITNRLMLYELRSFPKIRTVRHAARDLREQKLATGINGSTYGRFCGQTACGALRSATAIISRSKALKNRIITACSVLLKPGSRKILFGIIRRRTINWRVSDRKL